MFAFEYLIRGKLLDCIFKILLPPHHNEDFQVYIVNVSQTKPLPMPPSSSIVNSIILNVDMNITAVVIEIAWKPTSDEESGIDRRVLLEQTVHHHHRRVRLLLDAEQDLVLNETSQQVTEDQKYKLSDWKYKMIGWYIKVIDKKNNKRNEMHQACARSWSENTSK